MRIYLLAQTHLAACVRQNCQLAFSSATTTTFPCSSSMGKRPSISQRGAGLQMADWLLFLSTNNGEAQSRPGSEAKHSANSARMAHVAVPSLQKGCKLESLDVYPTKQAQ